jgi:protein involved in polysaccharide export with SLBB domain
MKGLRNILLCWCLVLAAIGSAMFATPAQAQETADRAVLRSGDIVLVMLPGEPALNKEFQIDSLGQILLPEVGGVTIAGMTVTAAAAVVRVQLARAYRELDRLRLTIKERRLIIQVLGFVKNPGTHNLPGDATVQTAITAAGGLAQGAQLDRLRVRRGREEIVFDYKKYLDTGDPTVVPALQPLDQIFVPSSPVTGKVHIEFDGRTLSQAGDGAEDRNSVKVFGEVHNPAVYSHKPGASVVDMLLRSGGVTRYATVEQIKIISGGQAVVFNLQTYLDSGDQKLLPPINPGATIFVPKQIEEIRTGARTVYVMGEVAKPGAFDMKAGATFVELLANAGGPTRFAETRQVKILRGDGNVETFDLVMYTEGKLKRMPSVNAGDAIFVPEKNETIEPSWLKIPPNRAVQLIGAVRKPGRYEWSSEMGLMDLLAAAGGPHEKADVANLQILTNQGGKSGPIKFDLQAYLTQGGALSSVPKIMAGYTINVPELPQSPHDNKALWTRQSPESSIYIMGAVHKPGRYAFNKAMGFLDILTAADGPTDKADLRNVRVSHRGRSGARVSNVNLARYFVTGDDALLPHVRTGDVIFVPDRNKEWLDDPKEATVRVLGAVHKAGRFRFTDEMTILDLLAEAGGPTPTALNSRILVVNMGLTEQARQFDLLSFAKTADTRMLPVVRAGDTVYVPEVTQHEVRQTLDFVKDVMSIMTSASSLWSALTTTSSTTTTTTTSAAK